jgi:hypothetical protein
LEDRVSVVGFCRARDTIVGMTRTFLLVFAAAALLPACSQNKPASTEASNPTQAAASQTAPAPAKSNDAMQQKVAEIAGGSAKDCGRPVSTDRAALDTAASCVMETAQAKKPFSVIYDMPGMSVAVAGNSEGKMFAVQSIQPEGASKGTPQMNVSPCPAELRVAQSGRVTCFPPGSMGVPPGAANPHAGSASAPSGHSGMMPPPGTPNPHAGNMTTKPSAKSKTPPQ